MRVPIGMRKLLAVLAAAAIVFGVFFALERPWFLRWGATHAEFSAVRTGDERFPGARTGAVRAVTVHAPPADVWPWIAQIGQDRGGFYSYDLLEDLVGCRMPRATRLLPGHQVWRAGDQLWMYPPDKAGGAGGARLLAAQRPRQLAFATRGLGAPAGTPEVGIWGFALDPVDSRTTRLIAYGRIQPPASKLAALASAAFFDPAHYAMERRLLLNVKDLAEGRVPSRLEENWMVALWTLAIVMLVVALVQVARRRDGWIASVVVAALAAFAFQWLTLAQPSIVLGTVVLLMLAMLLTRRPAVAHAAGLPSWSRS